MTSQEISAGMIIYRETKEGPKFLLTYHGGRSWSFPKGKLDGESNFKAALREVHEETGIAENELRFKHHFKARDRFVFTRERERILKTITYYLAETNKVAVTLPVRDDGVPGEPHEGYGWFLYRDALRMLLAPNLKRNLKRAFDMIRPAAAQAGPARPGARTEVGRHAQKDVPANRRRRGYRGPYHRTAGPVRPAGDRPTTRA